ncbi:MAG: nucleotidyltransferase domain-containing protein [Eubacterium sp.]|jgi:Predicted nucleotidyltransferases|nr:nucleotidyltransferase domain-containing protein [Eubacterium sp.]
MKYHLEKRVEDDIVKIARKNNIQKVILFGSRARGTNTERSDIDLAVSGGSSLDFYYDLEEEAWTLLMFDVVNLDSEISAELKKEIERDGIVLYEKIR